VFKSKGLKIPKIVTKFLLIWPLLYKEGADNHVIMLDTSGETPRLIEPLKLAFGKEDKDLEAIKGKIFESIKVLLSLIQTKETV